MPILPFQDTPVGGSEADRKEGRTMGLRREEKERKKKERKKDRKKP
jgi:hypothetical protein